MFNLISRSPDSPLEVEEVIRFIKNRWGVTYELRILVKGKSLYLQMMWRFLEQQSFPLSEEEFLERTAAVIDVINRIDKSSYVRNWLLNVNESPRVVRAISLPLRGDERLEEFVL